MLDIRITRAIGVLLIAFAVYFNIPYSLLAASFDYPAILRKPPGEILEAFAAGGSSLILTWWAFMLAALLFAPVAVCVARVTRGAMAAPIAALGVAAGVVQAIGLARWVYAVPGLAAAWKASFDPAPRAAAEAAFMALHQFAGVGVGEAIGQMLTGTWLAGVAVSQIRHPRFGKGVAAVGLAGSVVLVLGTVEGLATVMTFDPGLFGLGALVGFLLLTVWLVWTGVLCILRSGTP